MMGMVDEMSFKKRRRQRGNSGRKREDEVKETIWREND